MRLIDADELKKSIEEDEELKGNSLAYLLMNLMTCYIDDAPTIDAEPVRHGHWINAYPDIEPNPMFMYGICSECGFEQGISSKLNYCPNCGAKMDEEDNT